MHVTDRYVLLKQLNDSIGSRWGVGMQSMWA